ncbi:MAG TPA: PhzF family phenazine biosynthesis protein [Candidatus Eisenbacteria bacterium]|uniref:PhzF family phenazine biosynthesis protein n=1 Tax=Eiseniibacteriota bacterium TaxID=2212470 RepID=A0A7V2F2N6_UNCEI|nr:PhzF family phenazine biosynthesis protein [Candidatus Eisenbacteria bacterium]
MQQLTIKQVDAFTAVPFGGNPAGVITDASGLTVRSMQRIAAEMSMSETAFVSSTTRPDATFRIRFFTPTDEVDMSGHVIIAASFALAEDGRIELHDGITRIVFETNAGMIPIDIHFRPDGSPYPLDDAIEGGVPIHAGELQRGTLEKIVLNQKVLRHRPSAIPVSEIASILGIREREITKTGLPLEIISTGLEQLMIPVERKETIMSMHPDLIKLSLLDKRYGIDTNHIFSLDAYEPGSTSYSRHFAPKLGMWEDAATGTAAAGLGTYLLRHGVVATGTMMMEQGKEESRLARILVEIDDSDKSYSVAGIGGLAVTSITRTAQVDEKSVVIS